MMKRFLTIIIVIIQYASISAQINYTISGYVKDANTGEELIGANILIKELPGTGTSTNAYGFYSITILKGKYTVIAQFIGYESKSVQVELKRNIRLDYTLNTKTIEQKEVVVTGEKRNEAITGIQAGAVKLDMQQIKSVPVLLGEKDVLKTIQLLPGVESAGDGSSGYYVRGGASDQNLILLDEAVVYNPFHLLGFFSVFNSDAIKDVTLYKGIMPAEYGGRLSSVLDIRMKDGDDKKFKVNGGIGLIASRLSVEGPIVKNEGSFIVSGRRTYADLFLKLSKDTTINKNQLYFYDLNAKANYKLGHNNRIFASGYYGKDVVEMGSASGINWGNGTATLRWNHLFNDKLFTNTSFIFSKYDYNIHTNLGGTEGNIFSSIQDYRLKQDYEYFPNALNTIKFGFNSVYHKIVPGSITRDNNLPNVTNKYSWENAIYASHELKLFDWFGINYGLRFSSFSVLGPGDFYTYNSAGVAVDTSSYKSGNFIKTYFNLEPRISLNFSLSENSSVKAEYGRTTQNLHLISNSTSENPTDLWIPNSNNVKPEIADQISLGYYRNFDNNMYEFSVETYYKNLQNQIDYKDGADLRFNENVESQLLYGKGRAYGIELFLKKSYGRLTGWISYTLSRVEKKIDGINNNNWYPAKQDRTHDISIVATYQLTDTWTLSADWVYYTGNAVSFPSGKYEVAGQVVNYYTERNGYRMPAYNRLDIGATWQGKNSSWTFSLYNAYGRDNPYSINFQQSTTDPTKTEAVETYLFKFVPSITYNFRF